MRNQSREPWRKIKNELSRNSITKMAHGYDETLPIDLNGTYVFFFPVHLRLRTLFGGNSIFGFSIKKKKKKKKRNKKKVQAVANASITISCVTASSNPLKISTLYYMILLFHLDPDFQIYFCLLLWLRLSARRSCRFRVISAHNHFGP